MIIDRECKIGGQNYCIKKRVDLTEINGIIQSRA